VEQHVDLADFGVALDHPFHDAPHPASTLATGRALAAAFVLVELREPGDRLDDIGRLVHDDDRGGAEPRLDVAQRVEIHQHGVADRFRDDRYRGAARDDAEEIVPAAADAPGMPLDELTQRDTHRLLDIARRVDVAGDAEDLGALVLRPADAGEPGGAAAED